MKFLVVIGQILEIFVVPILVVFGLRLSRIMLTGGFWIEDNEIIAGFFTILLITAAIYAAAVGLAYYMLQKYLISRVGYAIRALGLFVSLAAARWLGTFSSSACDLLHGCTGGDKQAEVVSQMDSYELRISIIMAVLYIGAAIGLYIKLNKSGKFAK